MLGRLSATGTARHVDIPEWSRRGYEEHISSVSEGVDPIDMSMFIRDKANDFMGVMLLQPYNMSWVLDVPSIRNFLKIFNYKIDLVEYFQENGEISLYVSSYTRQDPVMRVDMAPFCMKFDLGLYSDKIPRSLLDVSGYKVERVEQNASLSKFSEVDPVSIFYPINHLSGNRLPHALMSVAKEIERSQTRYNELIMYR